tara:strand:- start:249 stop:452 length:204 start_codon:yes stop_codon:yes gene_type:complete
MSKLNTLSAGYKGSSTKIRSSNTRPPIINNVKVNADDLIKKIKIWHADGVLTTDGVNYIIIELQKII